MGQQVSLWFSSSAAAHARVSVVALKAHQFIAVRSFRRLCGTTSASVNQSIFLVLVRCELMAFFGPKFPLVYVALIYSSRCPGRERTSELIA